MSKQDFKFLEGKDSPATDVLKEISRAVNALLNVRKDIDQLEEQLKVIKKDEVQLSQEEVPNLLLERGLTSITLESGEKIEISEDLHASLSKDPTKRKIVLKWLVKNGGAGMIKEELTVEEPEKSLLDYLVEEEIPFAKIFDVHHSSLRAFLKSKLGITKGSLQEIEIGDIPKEANIFVFKKTKIK